MAPEDAVPADPAKGFLGAVAVEMSARLLEWAERGRAFEKELAILQSLRFDNLFRRRNDIQEAHSHTFTWVHRPDLHFAEWLETGDGVYWVTGDAGSGKSTLMKYLESHSTTRDALREWAGSKTLVTAGFYFWISGSPLQRSQEGLLRSLLFEIFRQCPAAISEACLSRWGANANTPWDLSDLQRPWDRHELLQTLRHLSLHSTTSKFCFFIDGLDEYKTDAKSQVYRDDSTASHIADIIALMNSLADMKDIKLCISSRPWPMFERAFGQEESRKLSVNNENLPDIGRYVRDRFKQSPVFSDDEADPVGLSNLIESVVENSRGVFLWVFLVTESLLRGLDNEDRIAELRQRLDATPKTLQGFYDRMLDNIDDPYREQAAQILQVALASDEPLSICIYSMIGDDTSGALAAEPKAWIPSECQALLRTATHRLKVRCPDLLNVHCQPDPPPVDSAEDLELYRVDFLHRTVRDFLSLDEVQNRLAQMMGSDFDSWSFICQATLMHLKAFRWENVGWAKGSSGTNQPLFIVAGRILRGAWIAEQTSGEAQTDLLDGLHRVVAPYLRSNQQPQSSQLFLELAMQHALHHYIEAKLPAALYSPGWPLLLYAVGIRLTATSYRWLSF